MKNSDSATEKYASRVEIYLKLTAAILGILYVLGLIVSNLHLMSLGITDFASLQTKDIMSGFLFVVYVVLLLAALIPIAIFISLNIYYFPYKNKRLNNLKTKSKITLIIAVIAISTILWSLFILPLIGRIYGFIIPWGHTWSLHSNYNELNIVNIFKTEFGIIKQLATGYWHPEIMSAGIYIILLTFIFSVGKRNSNHPILYGRNIKSIQNESSNNPAQRKQYRIIDFLLKFAFILIILPLLLIAFAKYSYPNIPSNIGGGQPKIAKLEIISDKSNPIHLPGIKSLRTTGQRKNLIITVPVAIWHKSGNFLYISPVAANNQSTISLLAIDIKLVQAILYLPCYAHVNSKARVIYISSESGKKCQ